MDFKQIISFKKVAGLKSFSKASKELYLSQPTVTSHILELEKELGVKLLNRSKSTVDLTPVGKIFLSYVNQIIALQNEAIETIEKLKNGKLGIIKLSVNGPDCYWLSPLLSKFKRYHSNVDIMLSVLLCHEIIDLVVNRKVNFGILRQSDSKFMHPLLTAKIVKTDDIVLVFSPEHKFAKLEHVTLTDISQEPLIAYGMGTNLWDQLLKIFGNYNLNPIVAMASSDNQAVKLFLKTSWGISFLPYMCVKEELDQGVLKTIPIIDCPPIKRYSILIYRKDMLFTDLTKSFLNMITEDV